MTYFESILLGLVQGLGEFLPISSSAHLVVLPWFVQFEDPGLGFDVALHLGTLFAVVAFFWKDWFQILTGSARYVVKREVEQKQNWFLLLALILATIPAAIAGVLLNEWAETSLRHPLSVALNMILLGALLLWADKKRGVQLGVDDMTYGLALKIGLAQCLALVPGVSRSGITITTALALGMNRSEAARFSFLMSTPIIFGACVFKYKYFAEALVDPKALIGIAVAALFGFLSIKYLLKLVQNYSYAVFSYYRFGFGALVLIVYFLRARG